MPVAKPDETLMVLVAGAPVTPLMKPIGVPMGFGANAPVPPLATDGSRSLFDEKLIPVDILATGCTCCNPIKARSSFDGLEFAIAEEIPHKSSRPSVKPAREEQAMKLSSRKVPLDKGGG